MQRNNLPDWTLRASLAIGLFVVGVISSWAQSGAPPTEKTESGELSSAIHELQEQVRELRAAVAEVRSQAAEYRAETAELRHQLEVAKGGTPVPGTTSAGAETETASSQTGGATVGGKSLENRVTALEDAAQMESAKVDEQYQTKIESASKYRIRLSGIVLMDLFSNRGNVDNQDVPTVALPPATLSSAGTFGATLRQSEIGLEVFGPRLLGAKTSAEVRFDFAGGFPNALNGANNGLVRLRTGSMRLDWKNSSIVVGQDPLFLSPLSPTSFASLSTPALSYSGNLWAWVPQLRVEHRFNLSENQTLLIQGGIFDNFVGEPPFVLNDRGPTSGERTSQPAYGARVAWSRQSSKHPVTLGTAGYYSRQNWSFDRYTDGWAAMADMEVPISEHLVLSGEFYRGRAIGGLGGGTGRSSLYSGSILQPTTIVRGLNAVGGWSQLKFKANAKLEFNGAFGLDNPYAVDLRIFPAPQSYYNPSLAQNRSALLNFVYRPRSNLIFSTEYRHIRTFQIASPDRSAEQVGLVMGVLF